MDNERTAEGVEETGLPPNPAVKREDRHVADTDPQLYEMFMMELCKKLGLASSAFKTIDEVAAWSTAARETGKNQRIAETQLAYIEDGKEADPRLHFFFEEMVSQTDLDAPSAWDILRTCFELATFLIDKNTKYGDSALDPVRIMSNADPQEQIRVRIDDKLSRLMRGQAGGEDPLLDLVGYWVLLKISQRRQG